MGILPSGVVRELESKGAALKAIEQPIDTSTAAGRAFLQMLGVFAEFETAIRRERQMEGIAAAKAKGVYKGRPALLQGFALGAGPVGFARRRRRAGRQWVGASSSRDGSLPMR